VSRNSPLAFWIVSILLGANLALIASYTVPIFLEPELQSEDDLLLRDTWDFGVGGRYYPGSSNIDANEKVVVILAETSDEKMSYSNSYFENILFGGSYGSMDHYYSEATYGYTDMTGVVIGPFRLPKSLTYYDPGDNENIREAIEDAVSLADSIFDFSPYDQDNDGLVDNIMVIFAGENDATNGGGRDPGAIWPHKWTLLSTYNTNDGVGVSKYFACPQGCGLGTYVHEIGHNFGLPDLYDTDQTSSGIGEWGVMAGGGYLTKDGEANPSHFSAWSKQELGLLQPTVVDISSSQSYTLSASSGSPDALKIPISNSEYYLIEYRSTTAGDYDAAIHSTGVLIWHIDEEVCEQNHKVNTDEDHPCVRLIQADGDNDLENNRNRGDAGDSWQSGRSFNPTSYPPSRSYSGSDVDVQMTITATYDTYATVHFGLAEAWFYYVTAEVQDSNGDGFNNEILFTYDPDTDGSTEDVMIQFDFYEADKTGTPYTFYDNRTIQGYEADAFEKEIGYYNVANGLWWIEVRLWIGDDMTDLEVFGNIWIEYPPASNSNDEYLKDVYWEPQDTTGDGNNDSLVVDFRTGSDQLGGTGNVFLEIYSDENTSDRHSQYLTNLEWGSHSITLDMSETDLPPGILRGNLVLYVDNEREHIASALNLDLWWDSVQLNDATVIPHDLDGDGALDSLEVSVNIDHSLLIDNTVIFEVNAWNKTSFDGFMSMQDSRTLNLGPIGESNQGGRGEQTFWLYAEWNQDVIIEIRVILPNGNEYIEMITWNDLTGDSGFELQPLDWTVTAWQTNTQLLDSNGDGQEDLFRIQYDLDSISEALDVAVELLVLAPDNSKYSIWDNYTINGDIYDLRTLEFPTWFSGQHEFTLRVHDLSDNKIEYEEEFGRLALSSAFAATSLELLVENIEGNMLEGFTSIRGEECQIKAILSDSIGEFYDSMGEIEWSGIGNPVESVPFLPTINSDVADCSQWNIGDYLIYASYENGLGIFVDYEIQLIVANQPPPPDILLDLSGVPDLGRDSCVIAATHAIDSSILQPTPIDHYKWYINGELSGTTTAVHSCAEFEFGMTVIEVYGFSDNGMFDVEKSNIILITDPETDDYTSTVEISPKDKVETESWGLLAVIVICVFALITPLIISKRRGRRDYSDSADDLFVMKEPEPLSQMMDARQDIHAPYTPPTTDTGSDFHPPSTPPLNHTPNKVPPPPAKAPRPPNKVPPPPAKAPRPPNKAPPPKNKQ
jgi:M6 family metalloprotease-like protein